MRFILILALSFVVTTVFAQPSNDECTGAIELGTLPTPNDCGGGGTEGQGAALSFPGLTNVNATAANPYSYIPDCQGTANNDMANPAQDVWYRFTASGNAVTINLSNYSGTFTNPSIGLWEGSCASLTARGCDNGTGGSLNVTLEPVTPGETYFIQISGNDATSEGTFDLSINNDNDCSQCNLSSNLTMDPMPTNGTYPVGTEVTFCYTVAEFEKVNSNWLHGISIESLGAGWDLSFGTNGIANPTVDPSTCQGNYGTWIWDDSPAGCIGNSNPGWYYLVDGSNSPCNNYGDPGVNEPGGGGGCSLTFCFTLRTDPLSSCNASNPSSLNVTMATSADGETGSWTNSACTNDPEYLFSAVQACCDTPTVVLDNNVTCFGGNDGQATATAGSPTGSYTYRWFNFNDSLEFETNNAPNTDIQSTLSAGTYTVWVIDGVGCVAANTVDVLQNPGAVITVDTNQIVCDNESVSVVNFVTDPVTATFQWTATTDIGFGTSGTTQIGTFTSTNGTTSPMTSTITATPFSAGCGGIPGSFELTVNPLPLLASSPDTSICDPETVSLVTSFDPDPITYDLSMSNAGLTVISTNSGGGGAVGSGVDSVVITGVEPTTLENGQILSACFSVKHQCNNDIDYFTLEVNGTTYTSTNGSPAGATFNTDLANMLTTIQGAANDVTIEVCFPQSFLNLLDGGATNSTWILTVNDFVKNNCSGGAPKTGDLVDFTVNIENTPSFSYSWSPDSSLSGTTSGISFVDTIPTVVAAPTESTNYVLTLTDPDGCVGLHMTAVSVACALDLLLLDLYVTNVDDQNILTIGGLEDKEFEALQIERMHENHQWELIETINYKNTGVFVVNDCDYKKGNNFYRVRMIKNANDHYYSDIVSINNLESSSSKRIRACYNAHGQEVDPSWKGFKVIYYEDGTIQKFVDRR